MYIIAMNKISTSDKNRKRLKEAIEKAKLRTNVTQVMESLGISRGNISGYLNGEDKRLSLKKVEALISRLEDPNSSITNQQKLSTYSPKKAAHMLSDAFFNYSDIKISPNEKGKFTEDVENWLKAVQEENK